MPERLVDVLRDDATLLHTFPVTVKETGDGATEDDFKRKAADAARYAQLVSGEERDSLTTRLHPDRGGALAPFGTRLGVLAETPAALEQCVRERAYYLWLQEGCPEGRADELWQRAHEQHIRERAYILWQQEGCPDGQADEYWYRTENFERQ